MTSGNICWMMTTRAAISGKHARILRIVVTAASDALFVVAERGDSLFFECTGEHVVGIGRQARAAVAVAVGRSRAGDDQHRCVASFVGYGQRSGEFAPGTGNRDFLLFGLGGKRRKQQQSGDEVSECFHGRCVC